MSKEKLIQLAAEGATLYVVRNDAAKKVVDLITTAFETLIILSPEAAVNLLDEITPTNHWEL